MLQHLRPAGERRAAAARGHLAGAAEVGVAHRADHDIVPPGQRLRVALADPAGTDDPGPQHRARGCPHETSQRRPWRAGADVPAGCRAGADGAGRLPGENTASRQSPGERAGAWSPPIGWRPAREFLGGDVVRIGADAVPASGGRGAGEAALVRQWAAENPRSAALHARARGLLPGGVTHDVRLADPFPLAVASAAGPRKRDLGRSRADLLRHGPRCAAVRSRPSRDRRRRP